MGQKTSPLSIRNNNRYAIWSDFENYSLYYKTRKYILNFFNKKGLLVNDLTIRKDNSILYIDIDFIVSKASVLYIKKFRKLLKKNNETKKNTLNFFLQTLLKMYDVKKIYLKAKKLDVLINKQTLNLLLTKSHKLGISRQLKNNYIKDLIISLVLLLENKSTKAYLITQILAKHFTWIPKKQHKRFFIFLRDLFKTVYFIDKQKNNNLLGIKLIVSGKISGKTQASNFRSIVGSVFNQTITKNVDYSSQTSFNKLGTFEWKLWISKN